MHRPVRSLRIGALTLALFVVGAAALASGNYAFAPPAGWARVRSGDSPKWMNASGQESVGLFSTTYAGDLTSYVNHTLKQERAMFPTQHVWTNKTYMVCGSHPGRYVIWTATTHAKNVIWEQMIALWGYDGYVVSYVRPSKNPPSNVARGSLVSICGVGSLPEQPGGVPIMTQKNSSSGTSQEQPQGYEPTPEPTDTISHPYVPFEPPD